MIEFLIFLFTIMFCLFIPVLFYITCLQHKKIINKLATNKEDKEEDD